MAFKTREKGADISDQLPAEVPQGGSLPAAASMSAPPSELFDMFKEDAGKGLSTKAEDNLIPMAGILQPLSPQVDARHPSFIPGAEPGSIMLSHSPVPALNGTEGMLFIPVSSSHMWVEWVPRKKGGGFVAQHAEMPEGATLREYTDENGEIRKKWVTPNGNDLIETRYRVGLVVLGESGLLPFVVPFTSTGHTVFRSWETLMNGLRVNGIKPPSYAMAYRLTTQQRTNASGTWFTYKVKQDRWVTGDEYQAAKALEEQMNAGARTIDASQDVTGREGATADPETAAM